MDSDHRSVKKQALSLKFVHKEQALSLIIHKRETSMEINREN